MEIIYRKTLTKIVQCWFWILYLWFEKGKEKYVLKKKNDLKKNKIIKKNGTCLMKWEYFVENDEKERGVRW